MSGRDDITLREVYSLKGLIRDNIRPFWRNSDSDKAEKEAAEIKDKTKEIQNSYYPDKNKSVNNSAGKGSSNKVVETVVIDPKVIKAAAKVVAQKESEESVEKEPEGR